MNVMNKYIFLGLISWLMITIISCKKRDIKGEIITIGNVEASFAVEDGKLLIPQDSNYTVSPKDFTVSLNVDFSDVVTKRFQMNVTVDNDTIKTMIADSTLTNTVLLPSNAYKLPGHLDVRFGVEHQTFKLVIDINTIEEYYGKKLALAVALGSPSKGNSLNSGKDKIIIIIDTKKTLRPEQIHYVYFKKAGEIQEFPQQDSIYAVSGKSIVVPMAVSLGGKATGRFKVNIKANPDTVLDLINQHSLPNTVLLDEDSDYSMPESLSFKSGQNNADFDLLINTEVLKRNAGKQVALALTLSDPSDHVLDSARSTLILSFDADKLLAARIFGPAFGADFSKPKVYDFSKNASGNPAYPSFHSLLTRGTGFDGEYVLIVSRDSDGPHLLRVSDLKNNNISNPLPLNLTGVSGGIYPYDCGAIINGHIYVADLAISQSQPLKVYHWTDPFAQPDVILNLDYSSVADAGARYGDNFSINLDENGNGYMFFGDNAVTGILRLKVSNYTNVSDPKVIPTQPGVTAFMTYNQVGNKDSYLLTGYQAPIVVVDENGNVSYTLDDAAVPTRGSDARVIYFNDDRYLMMTTSARSGSDITNLYIYDITEGNNIEEALDLFAASNKEPLYTYSLSGPTNAAPSTQTGWFTTKDDGGRDATLMIYTATTDAGFALIEFPMKASDD